MSKTPTASSRRQRTPRGPSAPKAWRLQDAKARFSEVFRLARENRPQRVTKHGREAVVVLSAEEFMRLSRAETRKESLADFFAASPLRESGIDLERPRDFGRKTGL